MDDFVSAFSNYYRSPTPDKIPGLFQRILSFDLCDWADAVAAVAALKKQSLTATDLSKVYSNISGSYTVGPFFGTWCPLVENYLRGRHVGCSSYRVVHFEPAGQAVFNSPIFKPAPPNGSPIAYVDFSSTKHRDLLLLSIHEHCHGTENRVCIYGRPPLWLYMSTSPDAEKFVTGLLPCLSSFVNEEWEPLTTTRFRGRALFNDQMIDWKTGINFYVCPWGVRHFLPIFSVDGPNAVNLLNLTRYDFLRDDSFSVSGEPNICHCGRFHVPFECRTKSKNWLDIDRGIVDELESEYLNLQFVVHGENRYLLYTTVGKMKDEQRLRNLLGDGWQLVKDMQFVIGCKRYGFWREQGPVSFKPLRRPGQRLL